MTKKQAKTAACNFVVEILKACPSSKGVNKVYWNCRLENLLWTMHNGALEEVLDFVEKRKKIIAYGE